MSLAIGIYHGILDKKKHGKELSKKTRAAQQTKIKRSGSLRASVCIYEKETENGFSHSQNKSPQCTPVRYELYCLQCAASSLFAENKTGLMVYVRLMMKNERKSDIKSKNNRNLSSILSEFRRKSVLETQKKQ